MDTAQKVYTVLAADSPSAINTYTLSVSASSERSAFRAARAQLPQGAVIRVVTEATS